MTSSVVPAPAGLSFPTETGPSDAASQLKDMDQPFMFGEPLSGEGDDSSSSSELSKDDMDQLIADLRDDDEDDNDNGEDTSNEGSAPIARAFSFDLPLVKQPSTDSLLLISGDDELNAPASSGEVEDPNAWMQLAADLADPTETGSKASDSEDEEEGDDNDEAEEAQDDDDDDNERATKRQASNDSSHPLQKRTKPSSAEPTEPQLVRKPSLNEDSAVANFILSPWM